MSRIVVLVRAESLSTPILKNLGELLSKSVMQISNAIAKKRPILEMEIFDQDYEEKASLLRRLIGRIREDEIAVEIYELLGDEPFESGSAPDGSMINVDVLERILDSADADTDHPR